VVPSIVTQKTVQPSRPVAFGLATGKPRRIRGRRDEWETKVRPALGKVFISTLKTETGLSRRMLIDARTGRRRPHPQNQKLIAITLRKLGVV